MTAMHEPKRLGFFTRLLDAVDAAERYRLATAQIVHAERNGFDSAWVAQHHFHEAEGGLPAPFVFLSAVAARTTRIRLGTGIVTLPLELPLRVAEDAAVLDLMSGGRLEVGVGPGGNLSAFQAFALDSADRHALFSGHLDTLKAAWTRQALAGGDVLYPAAPSLAGRVWQATFTVEGARRAGLAGDGLMLSRTQPRPPGFPELTLAEIQEPMIDAYLAALPPGLAPRILASRSIIPADDRAEMLRWAQPGLARMYEKHGRSAGGATVEQMIRAFDVHVGTPEEVMQSLAADATLARATDVTMQVHSVDPPHPLILRAIELFADVVAPGLGWEQARPGDMRKVA